MAYKDKPGEYTASLWPSDGVYGKSWKASKPLELPGGLVVWVDMYPVNSEHPDAPEFRVRLRDNAVKREKRVELDEPEKEQYKPVDPDDQIPF